MKGWIKALSVPLITALVLTGCGSGASTKKADRGEKKTSLQKSGNDTVLRVSGAEEDTELLKQVMENFKKDNPQIHSQTRNAKHTLYISTSFIQTLLSVLELHQVCHNGSRTLPPVGNCTLP